MALPRGDTFYLDNFAMRQWDDPNYSGTHINFDKEEFVAKVHEHYYANSRLVDGYAPFCKHVFVPNFVGAKVGSVAITPENQQSIRSGYFSRRPEELAVLERYAHVAIPCHLVPRCYMCIRSSLCAVCSALHTACCVVIHTSCPCTNSMLHQLYLPPT
jgi:hypothetical protein